jgi:hypothetical protein
MYCPDCGYEVDDTIVFCPQCRYQFRDVAGGPAASGDKGRDAPGYEVAGDESIPEEAFYGFSDRELLQMEVQLITPMILVVLIVSLIAYTVIATIPFVPITIAGQDFGVTGIVCLACGLVAGTVFFILVQRSLKRFRHR